MHTFAQPGDKLTSCHLDSISHDILLYKSCVNIATEEGNQNILLKYFCFLDITLTIIHEGAGRNTVTEETGSDSE